MGLHTWLPVSRQRHAAEVERAWKDANDRLEVIQRLNEQKFHDERKLHIEAEERLGADVEYWRGLYKGLLTSDAVLDRAAGKGTSLVGAIIAAVKADDLNDVFS